MDVPEKERDVNVKTIEERLEHQIFFLNFFIYYFLYNKFKIICCTTNVNNVGLNEILKNGHFHSQDV